MVASAMLPARRSSFPRPVSCLDHRSCATAPPAADAQHREVRQVRAAAADCVRRSLPKPNPGIEAQPLARDAGRHAGGQTRRAGMRALRRPRRRSAARLLHGRAARPACASGKRPRSVSATASSAPGVRSAAHIVDHGGARRPPPARSLRGLLVSTEIGTSSLLGQALAPPASRAAAPRRRRPAAAPGPRRLAADVDDRRALSGDLLRVRERRAGSRKRPPSENESGVTLSTPMTTGSFRCKVPRACRNCRRCGSWQRAAQCWTCGRADRLAWPASTGSAAHAACRRSPPPRVVPAFGRLGLRPAMMSLICVFVDGLVLDQRVGHRVQLVEVATAGSARALS